jgi:L,D-transpeptidase YcbB
VRRDAGYLQRHELRVVTSAGRVIDPTSIDWNTARAASFPYRFRQDPGPRNPLGGAKFLLPNPDHVFLHDTPGRAAFARADRALSHGCIRIEKPDVLAQRLLAALPGWDSAAIAHAMHAGVERTVAVPRPVPVLVRYETAWVAADGTTHFRDDIYGHDARVRAALRARVAGMSGAEGEAATRAATPEPGPAAGDCGS